jgi:hypothetical protein
MKRTAPQRLIFRHSCKFDLLPADAQEFDREHQVFALESETDPTHGQADNCDIRARCRNRSSPLALAVSWDRPTSSTLMTPVLSALKREAAFQGRTMFGNGPVGAAPTAHLSGLSHCRHSTAAVHLWKLLPVTRAASGGGRYPRKRLDARIEILEKFGFVLPNCSPLSAQVKCRSFRCESGCCWDGSASPSFVAAFVASPRAPPPFSSMNSTVWRSMPVSPPQSRGYS